LAFHVSDGKALQTMSQFKSLRDLEKTMCIKGTLICRTPQQTHTKTGS